MCKNQAMSHLVWLAKYETVIAGDTSLIEASIP